jgi:hypothetical protein
LSAGDGIAMRRPLVNLINELPFIEAATMRDVERLEDHERGFRHPSETVIPAENRLFPAFISLIKAVLRQSIAMFLPGVLRDARPRAVVLTLPRRPH